MATTITASTSFSAPPHELSKLESIRLDDDDAEERKEAPLTKDKATPVPSATPVQPCCGCYGNLPPPALGTRGVDGDDEYKSAVEGPPSLADQEGNGSFFAVLSQNSRKLSTRVSRSLSALFQDAEEPGEDDMHLFRSLSRRVSSLNGMRKERSTQKSLTNLGITLDDADVPPNFIRAANGDMPEARRMYVNTLKWRKENNIDTILLEKHGDFESILEASPHFMLGRSKDGSPVSYELNGLTNPALFARYKIKPNDIARHQALITEYSDYALYSGAKSGHYFAVFDLKGMTIMKASSPLLLSILRTYAETITYHYPDILRKVLVVNAPYGASTIIKILRAVLPRDFNNRIVVLNKHEELLEYIDVDELSVKYGGRNENIPEESEPWKGLLEMIAANRRGDANFIYAPQPLATATDEDITESKEATGNSNIQEVPVAGGEVEELKS